ncbi:sensor histidine kinase [Levilinea saccharolytica]|uniref:Histidine kinase domain-containing protein n=1 Tax=Levilinea saccharolytica TaxID=229921 RepID=A0A0P6XSI7_9CHLR|nr:GAF domain-containing sensor histidine kinase [Levilinea saccharolytica]KPL83335.1 hypothetical protein ADN01_08605 [Levilinea saccharolytica]GAP16200.1 histidine kinase [Levilinea saccharolytica]
MVTLTREQLEDRLAALHRASLELVQDISLESLLYRIAVLACEQAQAQFAAVGVLDENGGLERFIPVGMSDAEVAMMEHPPRGLGLIGELMRSSETIRVDDMAADPRSAGFPAHHPPMTSFLGVPIRQSSRSLGQIYLTNKIGAPAFTQNDQQVIETLASYAAIAISNARLYRQLIRRDRVLTRRNENLALLNKLASTLATSGDVDEVLNRSLKQVLDYLGLEAGEIYLRQGSSKLLKRTAHRSRSGSTLWAQAQFLEGEGMVGTVAKTGQSNLVNLGESDETPDLLPAARQENYRQVACFPLTGRQGAQGVFCVAAGAGQPLGDLEMQFLAAISSWVGTAIENVQLNLQQRRLAVLEERERFGMDLHDGVIQSIYAVGLTLEHARLLLNENPDHARQRIDQAISDLNSTIRDIRAYILDLRPRQLHDENLMEGIKRLVNEFRVNSLVDVNLSGPTTGFPGLQEEQAITLFHICQEALANIAKHARAKHVEVSLWMTADRALLEVSDDGRGFDETKVKVNIGHGLSNMQTRTRNVGGDVDISSAAGEGTTVLAWVPLSKEG